MIPVSPSREEVEAKKASLRHLGAHELQRRVDSDEIGFGSWERRVAQSVLWDIAAEKRASHPTANGNAIRLGALLVVALTLALKLLGII